MANQDFERSHVAGFVRGYSETQHGQMSFRIHKEKFLVSKRSPWANEIEISRKAKVSLLIVFIRDGKHPTVLGAISMPLWREVSAASRGLSFSEIKAIGEEAAKA